MNIVHLHCAGRHARQTRKAAVEMANRVRLRRPAFLEHCADEVDPPTRRFILVARKNIGRAGVRAEAVMHTGLQNRVGFGDMRVAQLSCGEIGLHEASGVAASITCCAKPASLRLAGIVGAILPRNFNLVQQNRGEKPDDRAAESIGPCLAFRRRRNGFLDAAMSALGQ